MRKRDRVRALLAPGASIKIRPAPPGSITTPAQPVSPNSTPTLAQPALPIPPSPPVPNSIASSRVKPVPVKSQNQALGKAVELQLQKLPEAGRAAFEKEIKSLDEHSLLSRVRAYDEKHKNESSFRPHADRLTKGLDLISRLMRGVAIGIQADPAISSPVVGVLRVIIDIGLEFSKFFTRLTDMICEFEDYLGPLSEHSQAADNELVETAVVSVYTNMLDFGWKARSVFADSNGKRRRFTSFRAFKRQHWDTFETEFMSMKQQMQHHLHVLQHTVQATHFNHSRITAQKTERTAFLSWASDVDFEEVHETTYAKKHKGTGDWLTREPKFQAWMQSSRSTLLWCNGKPGIGKSVLSSHVLEYITAEAGLRERAAICFAYYNYRDTRLASIATIIATLIKQLCQGMHDIPENLLQIMRNARSPSLLGSKEYFFSLTEKFSEVFVVLDALDECPEERREGILGFITEVVTMPAPHRIRVFATSPREMDITEAFLKKHVPIIQISADSVAVDIETFARSRVEELRSGQHGKTLYITNDDFKEEIIWTLAQKAEGMFLWVNLQLENLCQASKARKDEVVREALNTLPRSLPDTYTRILERIETQSLCMRDLAIRCLAWVLYAERPLASQELQVVLAVNSKCKTRKDLRPVPQEVILEACGNLLEEASGVTRPIHYTVQEFLTAAAHGQPQDAIRRQLLDSKSVHKNLSLHCLTYIDLTSFCKPVDDRWELYHRIHECDLAMYAYTNVDYHIWNCGEPSPDVMNQLEKLLQQDSTRLAALLQIILMSNGMDFLGSLHKFNSVNFLVTPGTIIYGTRLYNVPAIRQRWVGQTPPIYALHLAASAGLVNAVRRLLEDGFDVDKKDDSECTSMYYACQSGHLEIAQILASKGADIHARGGYFDNALQAASYQGHTQIVKMLLGSKADVNVKGGAYGNALQAASYRGHKQVVKMLLDTGADVDALVDEEGVTLLKDAAASGYDDIVEMLLSAGANVNEPAGKFYNSALQAASVEGHEQTVQILLNAGAHVNAQGGEYGSPLKAASRFGHGKIVRMLLDAGADVDATRGGRHGSALEAASAGCHEQIVQILLDAGADVDATIGGRYGSALQAASTRGHKQVVQMLLNAGADVNLEGGHYGSALRAASREGHVQIVQMLLDAGASPLQESSTLSSPASSDDESDESLIEDYMARDP